MPGKARQDKQFDPGRLYVVESKKPITGTAGALARTAPQARMFLAE
jgi:hypothetical protein